MVFLLLLLFLQLLQLFLFLILFNILFISSTSCNSVFCTFAVTSLMNSYFTSFLCSLPLSHFTFLSLLNSLNFQSNLALTKKWSDSISASLTLLTSQTFVQFLLFPICDLSGYTFCCQVIPVNVLMLITCSHHR